MEMKDEYEKHQSRKIKAREEKKKDKEMAISSPELLVGTFDLQAVLQTPCSLVSQLIAILSRTGIRIKDCMYFGIWQ
jgi:hypothetical protein